MVVDLRGGDGDVFELLLMVLAVPAVSIVSEEENEGGDGLTCDVPEDWIGGTVVFTVAAVEDDCTVIVVGIGDIDGDGVDIKVDSCGAVFGIEAAIGVDIDDDA